MTGLTPHTLHRTMRVSLGNLLIGQSVLATKVLCRYPTIFSPPLGSHQREHAQGELTDPAGRQELANVLHSDSFLPRTGVVSASMLKWSLQLLLLCKRWHMLWTGTGP
eukprot:1585248-Heterocapsa_arctica.AAC.1